MTAYSFSLGFAALLILALSLQLWLLSRQVRHVRAAREAVPAAFAQKVTLAEHQKAADYNVVKARFGILSAGFEAFVLLSWTLLGGLDWLSRFCQAMFGNGLGSQLMLLLLFALIGTLIDLPFSVWRTFRIEQRFGFNRMTPALFVSDLLKGLLLGGVLLGLLGAAVLTLMHYTQQFWWLWAYLFWLGFSLLMMLIYPIWIAPLFNKFSPLGDDEVSKEVKQRANQLLERCQFAAKDLLQMDGSRRSAHANAYFTGFGKSRRVVLFDTLLKQLRPSEIEAVLAHELGHFKLGHIRKRLLVTQVLAFFGFALLGYLSSKVWFYAGLGVNPFILGRNDAQALLLFGLLMPVVTIYFSPLSAFWSRKHEFEADAFACQHAPAPQLASALVKLHADNAGTLTPDPWYVRFFYSHPPIVDRLAALPKVA